MSTTSRKGYILNTNTNTNSKKEEDNNNPEPSFTVPFYHSRLVNQEPWVNRNSTKELKRRYKSAQIQQFSDGTKIYELKDPYNKSQKMRLEDAYNTDETVRRGINLYAKFLMGRRTQTVMDVNQEFINPEVLKQVLADTLSEQEVDQAKTFIDKINRKVKFHEKVNSAVIQSFIFGRAALLVETKQGGVPADLKVLSSVKLGRVFADIKTWALRGVEYEDRPKEEPLLAEELIYFSTDDHHVSPDTIYYGRSKIEPAIHMVETNRYLNEEDIKEAARISWAKAGLATFPPNIPLAKLREFIQGFQPGVFNATSQQVKIETFDLNTRIMDLIEVRQANQRAIQTCLAVPQFLFDSQLVVNRSTADVVMHAWRESDLNDARTWLQNTLEPQWFDKLLKIYFPSIDIDEMWIKAKLEFEDITWESLKDKSEAVLPLVQAGLIPPHKALSILDMEDVNDEMAAENEQAMKQRQQQLQLMIMERQAQGGFPGQQQQAEVKKPDSKEKDNSKEENSKEDNNGKDNEKSVKENDEERKRKQKQKQNKRKLLKKKQAGIDNSEEDEEPEDSEEEEEINPLPNQQFLKALEEQRLRDAEIYNMKVKAIKDEEVERAERKELMAKVKKKIEQEEEK